MAVETDDGPARLAASKERNLLGLLLADANRAIAPARLVDELWGDDPPASAHKTLQTYVSHLRRFLGDRLQTLPGGYSLRVEPHELDVAIFERTVAEGRLAALRGEHDAAQRLLGDALALWRGDPYADVWSETAIRIETVRLQELRLGATEVWVESRLAGGEHSGVVPELERLVAMHPHRERLWGLLMTALDLCGRQRDALRTFQRARTYLVDAVGLEPGPDLREIERAIISREATAAPLIAEAPQARYVTTDDGLKIAFWTAGEGDRDVVFCAEIFHNLELLRELQEMWAFLEPLTRTTRLIAIQRRGTGLSDRESHTPLSPPLACVADIDAVLDTTGSASVSLVGWGHGGQVALAYAAARPDRVDRAAVVNSYARLSACSDYPVGIPSEILDQFSAVVEQVWGTHRPLSGIFDPRIESDQATIRRVSRLERLVATPKEAAELRRCLDDFDIRPLLPAVQCPVLVAHLTGSITGAPSASWLADQLPSAEYVEAPGYFIPTEEDAAGLAAIVEPFLVR